MNNYLNQPPPHYESQNRGHHHLWTEPRRKMDNRDQMPMNNFINPFEYRGPEALKPPPMNNPGKYYSGIRIVSEG